MDVNAFMKHFGQLVATYTKATFDLVSAESDESRIEAGIVAIETLLHIKEDVRFIAEKADFASLTNN